MHSNPTYSPKNNLHGILWMILGAFSLSVLSTISSIAVQKLHIFQVFTVSTFFAFLTSLIFFTTSKEALLFSQHKKYLHFYIIRSALNVAGMFVWYAALKNAPLTEATAISFITPLLNATCAISVLSERATIHRISALVLGFGGALIILQPQFKLINVGCVLALLATIIWVITDIYTKSNISFQSSATQCCFMMGLMTLISLPFAIFVWGELNIGDTLYLALLGILQYLNLFAVFNAYKKSQLMVIMPFDFTRLIFTSVLAFIFLGEVVKPSQIAGSLLIILSMTYISYKETISQTKHKTEI